MNRAGPVSGASGLRWPRPRSLLVTLALVAIGLSPLWRTLALGTLPDTHEYARYAIVGELFAQAQQAGIVYPRWIPSMNGGYGYPLFVFYQPVYFFFHGIAAAFLDDLVSRQLATTGALAILGATGMFLLARTYLQRWQALVITAIFQFAPYVRFNLEVRGDLSEWTATQLFPWCLYFLRRFLDCDVAERWRSWLGLVLSCAFTLCAHPVALVFLPLLVGAIAMTSLGFDWRRGKPVRLLIVVEGFLGVILALVLASPYWLGIAIGKDDVAVGTALISAFPASSSTLSSRDILIDGAYFGVPFLAIALAGAYLGRACSLVLACGLTLAVLMLMTSHLGKPIWEIQPFSMLMFPFRIAAFAPALTAVSAIGLFRAMPPIPPTVAASAALFWIVIKTPPLVPMDLGSTRSGNALPCLSAMPGLAARGSFLDTLDYGEWQPKTSMRANPLPPRGRAVADDCATRLHAIGARVQNNLAMDAFPPRTESRLMESDAAHWGVQTLDDHDEYRLAFRFDASSGGRVILNQLYFPGWTMQLNGEPVPSDQLKKSLLPDGRMSLLLPAGSYEVRATYEGPLHWRERNLVIAIACLIAAAYWLVATRRSRPVVADRDGT